MKFNAVLRVLKMTTTLAALAIAALFFMGSSAMALLQSMPRWYQLVLVLLLVIIAGKAVLDVLGGRGARLLYTVLAVLVVPGVVLEAEHVWVVKYLAAWQGTGVLTAERQVLLVNVLLLGCCLLYILERSLVVYQDLLDRGALKPQAEKMSVRTLFASVVILLGSLALSAVAIRILPEAARWGQETLFNWAIPYVAYPVAGLLILGGTYLVLHEPK